MERRRFLKSLATLGVAPVLLNGIPVRVMANSMATQLTCAEVNDRVLVVVQLHGGNDGLNMVVPLNQLSTYNTLRPNIALPNTGARPLITLDSTLAATKQVGLNAEMTAFKSLYDQGKLALLQNSGYANNNKSHFKAKDDWLTGSDSTNGYNSGWMGRFLNNQYPNYPQDFPNTFMPDPLGLELGSTSVSLAFHRDTGGSTALAMKGDPSGYYSLVSSVGGPVPTVIPTTHYGDKLQRIINTQESSNNYAQRIDQVYQNGTNSSAVTYPLTYHTTGVPRYNNELSPQLKTVARLISGGSKTKIFWVRITGFDTHVNQNDVTDPSQGTHAILMYHLTQAIKAFHDDLAAQGLEDRVTTVTFSEFGRRAAENGSNGTDHGTFAPMFVVGKHVNAGVLGDNADLGNLQNNDLNRLDHDYRQVFTTLMQDWLGADNTSLAEMNFQAFSNQKLPLITSQEVVPTSCYLTPLPVTLSGFEAIAQTDHSVRCNWFTTQELNSKSFVIERSQDGEVFEGLEELPAAGNSQDTRAYEFVDTAPFMGISYYRLKQIDINGQVAFYPKVAVHLFEGYDELTGKIYPNPADDYFHIELVSSLDAAATLRISDTQGRVLQHAKLNLTQGTSSHRIDCSSLSSGMYIVTTLTSKGEEVVLRLMKH